MRGDLACCVAAWQAGAKYVRLHVEDVEVCGDVVEAIVEGGYSKCVVLSPQFTCVWWYEGLVKCWFVESLKAKLPSVVVTTGATSAIWLVPANE